MAERGYMLTHADMLRLQRALQKIEQYLPDAPIKDNTGPLFVGKQDVLWASVTSITQTSGRYPALLARYDPSAADGSRWTDDTVAIWLESANGEPLVTGIRYQVALRGHDENRYVYVVDDVSGGAGAGILSINDSEEQHQTVGVGIEFTENGFLTDNDINLTTNADVPQWASTETYHTGWVRAFGGFRWQSLVDHNLNNEPSEESDAWLNIGNDTLHMVNVPRQRIYTPEPVDDPPYRAIGNPNFKFIAAGIIRIFSDSETNEVTFLVPETVQVINITNIYETNNYVENVMYFNTFNNTIITVINEEVFIFYTDCCEARQYYCMTKASVQNCYNLLPSEYALMIIDGFAYVSGPHATKVICLASCSEVPTAWWCLECAAVQGCYELTEAELDTKIFTDLCTPIGKHATQAECLAACDVPDPIDTDCCPDDPTPVTLYGVLSGAADGCECMNGVPFSMVYDSGTEQWNAVQEVIAACATIDGNLYLWCDAGTWNLDVDGVGHCPDPGINVVTLVDCNPLTLTCTVSIINCGCGSVGTATLTITEVAP